MEKPSRFVAFALGGIVALMIGIAIQTRDLAERDRRRSEVLTSIHMELLIQREHLAQMQSRLQQIRYNTFSTESGIVATSF